MLEYDCIESSRPKGPYMKNEKNKKRNSQKVCVRHPVVEEGRLAERERRLKDLEQLTLLSDVFMSVALSDLKACQHVVRILTGNPGITLASVKTQYVISKAISHGARLDVLAEDTEKTLYHLEIGGADVADPFDDSEGELSKRVRFLKTEEGGIEIMCEIMERIREEGRLEGKQSGRLESSRRTAVNLERMGMPPETIARAVEEDVTVVKQWLKAKK